MTAIRNGDIDDNPATERDATWMPIDVTPAHPEYPCAHCITSGAIARHGGNAWHGRYPRGRDHNAYRTGSDAPVHQSPTINAEVANARIYAGFHYRYSTVVGTDMGQRVGDYVVTTVMLPLK